MDPWSFPTSPSRSSLADGKKSVTYGDGMTASIDKTGFGKVSLPNGITLAFTKDGMVTSFAGQTITEAAVTGYALDAKGAKTLSYENGMQVAVEPNGRTKVSFPNTLTIQINALDDMKSSIAGVTFNDTPIKQFMCEANGDMAALYQSGDVLVIMPEGSVAYALANGLVFASDGTWTGTFYGSTAISESAITGYTRGDDGKQTVTYADGLVLSVEKAGWVTIAVPNGITIATGEKGWNTTYQGMLVTRAAVNGFQTQGDERLLSFEDGMMVYTKEIPSLTSCSLPVRKSPRTNILSARCTKARRSTHPVFPVSLSLPMVQRPSRTWMA